MPGVTRGHPSCWEGRAAAKHQFPASLSTFLSVPAFFRLSSCQAWAELSVWHSEEQETNDPAGKNLGCYMTSPGKPARDGGVTHKPSWHSQSSTCSVLKPEQPQGVMPRSPQHCREPQGLGRAQLWLLLKRSCRWPRWDILCRDL